MGLLQDGQWVDRWYDTGSSGGRFVRKGSSFRHWITPDGSAGSSGEAGFAAEPGRYHLYVSLACPWAHRTLIVRARKQLEQMISVSVVHWRMAEDGWTFDDGPGVIPDAIHGARCLHQIYTASQADYSGRVTVPVLWDRKTRSIVSNESSDIMRMFGSAFDAVGAAPGDDYPLALRRDIDALNERIYASVNNGVYKAGFATSQAAYEEALPPLFETLDWLEARLKGSRFLCGSNITEADWRLFTTLVRFDAVYFGHFKCNLRRLVDYSALFGYTRDLYQQPGVAATVSMQHIKGHYYASHGSINPTGIVPLGPAIDFSAPHNRDSLISPGATTRSSSSAGAIPQHVRKRNISGVIDRESRR
jgi:putative glutathione S-transferase